MSTKYNFCLSCGANEDNKRLIKISGIEDFCICEKCIQIASDVLVQNRSNKGLKLIKNKNQNLKKYTPSILKKYLDKYIIGQEDAKKKISIAVYNHYKRVYNNDLNIDKSNIMLLGPSGTGKTEIARVIAKVLDVPFAIADATSLTEAGYVGDDVENILLKLIQAADGDIKKAEYGIIYIDEIDKIARKSANTSITRDVSGEGVQQSLLKIIEGNDKVRVPIEGGRKHPQGDCIEINTNNILFIAAGAFDGIDQLMKDSNNIGFNLLNSENNKDNKIKYTSTDIIKYGLMREFVGRFPVITQTQQLTKKELKQILIEPENCITKQYIELLKIDKVNLVFTDEFLDYIVDESIKNETGARGLRSAIEDSIENIMFEAPDMKDNITIRVTPPISIIKLKEA